MALLTLDSREFAANYNKLPFKVGHRLAEHPLFEMKELRALALRLPRSDVLHRHAVVPIDADFERAHLQHSLDLSLEETFDRLAEVKGYIVLNTPETDAIFRAVVDEALRELRVHVDPIDPGFYWFATYLFISSGGSVTPYHMDREMNFLLQVQGKKKVTLWNPADRAVMTEVEREVLFADYTALRPQWRESHRALEMNFEIGPGEGVHHPFIAPHVVVNGDAPSISWAITFRTRGSDAKGFVHRANHLLRKVGLSPTPQGRSPLGDRVKANTFRAAREILSRVRPNG